MGYDEALAQRIRAILADEPGLTEKKMFGGLGFMLDGHMAAAAGSNGGLMLRVDPATGARLCEQPGIRPQEMRGKVMTGWLTVAREATAEDAALRRLVAYGVEYVRSLPPKAASTQK